MFTEFTILVRRGVIDVVVGGIINGFPFRKSQDA